MVVSESKPCARQDAVWLEVFKFLSYPDVVKTSSVSVRWNALASSDFVWKSQCEFYWLLKELPVGCDNWKSAFIARYKAFHEYIDCYRYVKGAWNSLEDWLKKHCPLIFSSLKDGIAEGVIHEYERQYGLQLPKDLKLSYLIHNGQETSPSGYGLLGSHYKKGPHGPGLSTFFLLEFSELFDDSFGPAGSLVLSCSEKMTFLQLVKSAQPADAQKIVAFSSWYRLDSAYRVYEVAETFTRWFSEYVKKVVSGRFPVDNGRIMSYDSATEVRKVFYFVETSVRWSLINTCVDGISTYSLRLRMKMNDNTPSSEACKVVKAYCNLTDLTGHLRTKRLADVVVGSPVLANDAEAIFSLTVVYKSVDFMVKGAIVLQSIANSELKVKVPFAEFRITVPWKTYSDLSWRQGDSTSLLTRTTDSNDASS